MGDIIRVLIVDDHPVFRYGLRSLLARDPAIHLAGEAENAADALTMIEAAQPEILLTDIRMPGADGIDLLRRVQAAYPAVKTIILTAYDDRDYMVEALAAGAFAYLFKNASHDILLAAIHSIHAGQKLLTPEQTNLVLGRLQHLTATSHRSEWQLTESEIELLRLMADGLTYETIAQKTYLSEPTVKRMVGAIITKMGVSSRTQAVAEAIRSALI